MPKDSDRLQLLVHELAKYVLKHHDVLLGRGLLANRKLHAVLLLPPSLCQQYEVRLVLLRARSLQMLSYLLFFIYLLLRRHRSTQQVNCLWSCLQGLAPLHCRAYLLLRGRHIDQRLGETGSYRNRVRKGLNRRDVLLWNLHLGMRHSLGTPEHLLLLDVGRW